MTRIALATSSELPQLWAGDRILLAELLRRGWNAAPVVWDDAGAEWDQWDAVIIRSCWDYHLKPEKFCRWLEQVAAGGRPVINRPDLISWNLHKRYLLDLARAGCRIPDTELIPRGANGSLRSHIDNAGWAKAVIKPAISATGHSTRLIDGMPSDDDERTFRETVAAGDVLAQAYVPEVAERGEWSLVFFDGVYSHAVLKRAAPGEFRVHIEWGGTVDAGVPPDSLIRQAEAVMNRLALDATYARVDGTDVGGTLVVMELEVIEPELFFDRHPPAATRLADAVERILQGQL